MFKRLNIYKYRRRKLINKDDDVDDKTMKLYR